MKTIGEIMVMLRQEVGWSQEALAQRVGVARSQVSRWERGMGGIDDQKLARIADAFSEALGRRISTDYLLGREERTFATTNTSHNEALVRLYPVGMTQSLPVFDRVAEGAEPHLVDREDVPMSELTDAVGPYYLLEVTDDSMAGAGIAKGHRVLIDTGAEIGDGDIVLAQVEGDSEARLRQYYTQGDQVLLLADSSGGRPALIDSHKVKVFGRMMWGKYKPKAK